MARDFYQLNEAQRVALLHQRIHQRLLAQKQQQQQMPLLLQPQRSQDSLLTSTSTSQQQQHGPLEATSSNDGWWGCNNLLCNFLSKYSVSKTAGKVFAGLCCAGAGVAVELAVLAEGAQHHFEEMYHASTCLFNFSLVLLLYWLVLFRRHKDWLNLIDISVSLLAGGLILGPTILLYNATFAEPDEYLIALTPQPTSPSSTTTTTTTTTTTASPSSTTASSVSSTELHSRMLFSALSSSSSSTPFLAAQRTKFLSPQTHPSMLPLSSPGYDHPYAVGFGDLAYHHHHQHHHHHHHNSSVSFSPILFFDVPTTNPASSAVAFASTLTPIDEMTTRSYLDDDDDDDDHHQQPEQQVELTGANLIGAAGLKCHGTAFSITHSNEVQFCAGMLTAVACGFAAFLGFIVNAVHVILADTRGEYFLQPQQLRNTTSLNSLQNVPNNNNNRLQPRAAPSPLLQGRSTTPNSAARQSFKKDSRQQNQPPPQSSSATTTTTSPSNPSRQTNHHSNRTNHHQPLSSSPLLNSTGAFCLPNTAAAAAAVATADTGVADKQEGASDNNLLHLPLRTTVSATIETTSRNVERGVETRRSIAYAVQVDLSQQSLHSTSEGDSGEVAAVVKDCGDSNGCHTKLNECLSYASIMSAPTAL